MKNSRIISLLFWTSIIFALLFTTYLKQHYLATKVLENFVNNEAVISSWFLAILIEFVRGSFAYATFLASSKGWNSTRNISYFISISITGFDYWEANHYLHNEPIVYTFYFLITITLALELLGGIILNEIITDDYYNAEVINEAIEIAKTDNQVIENTVISTSIKPEVIKEENKEDNAKIIPNKAEEEIIKEVVRKEVEEIKFFDLMKEGKKRRIIIPSKVCNLESCNEISTRKHCCEAHRKQDVADRRKGGFIDFKTAVNQ